MTNQTTIFSLPSPSQISATPEAKLPINEALANRARQLNMARFYRLAKRPDLVASGGGLFSARKRKQQMLPENNKNVENRQEKQKTEENSKDDKNTADEMAKLPPHVLALINGENVVKERLRLNSQNKALELDKSGNKQQLEKDDLQKSTESTESSEK